jgi:hypothetical protein
VIRPESRYSKMRLAGLRVGAVSLAAGGCDVDQRLPCHVHARAQWATWTARVSHYSASDQHLDAHDAPSLRTHVHTNTHLAMRSSCPASKLMRFAVSMAGGPLDLSRFEVLLFLTSEAYSEDSRKVGRVSKWASFGREPGGVGG